MLAGKVDHTNFSREFSGVVTVVADGVKSLKVGDSVCGICVDQYSTYQIVLEGLCQKIDAHTQEVCILPSHHCFSTDHVY